MTDFPTILYRTPGPFKKPRGGTYATIGCEDKEAFDALIAKGWSASYEEALIASQPLKPKAKEVEKAEEPIDEVSAPTREELEAKAEELNVSYDGRTSDKKLAERIAKALEE
jgi:hypothetical protein